MDPCSFGAMSLRNTTLAIVEAVGIGFADGFISRHMLICHLRVDVAICHLGLR